MANTGATTTTADTKSDEGNKLCFAERLAKARASEDKVMQRVSDAVAKDKMVKADGLSFPVLVEDCHLNRPGFGGKISYSLRCTVGSLRGARGDGCYVHPSGRFALLAMNLGHNPQPNAVVLTAHPRSIVSGEEIRHKLVVAGSTIMSFTENADCSLAADSAAPVYIASLRATLSLAKPAIKKTGPPSTATAATANVDNDGAMSFDAASQTSNALVAVNTTAPVLPRANFRKFKQPAYLRLAASSTDIATGTGDGVVPMSAGRNATYEEQVPRTSPFALKDPAGLMDMLACLDLESICSPFLVDVYRDKTSKEMTGGQRIAFEYMFPHLANVSLPPAAMARGMLPRLSLNCEKVVNIQPSEYVGQDHMDMVELLRHKPRETVVTLDMLRDASDTAPPIVIMSRPECDAREVYGQRYESEVPPACTVVCDLQPVMTSTDSKKGPFTYMSTLEEQNGKTGPCLRFTACISSWPPGMTFVDAQEQGKVYHAALKGAAYDKCIRAFGVSLENAWECLAPNLVRNVPFWLWTHVDHDKTSRLSDNLSLGGEMAEEGTHAVVRVDKILADLAHSIRDRFGIPITPECAVQLVNIATDILNIKQGQDKRAPLRMPEPQELESCRVDLLPACTCITERSGLFAAALAAHCDFFAVSSIQCNWRVLFPGLAMTPALGAALFSNAWSSPRDKIILPDGRVLLPTDPLRTSSERLRMLFERDQSTKLPPLAYVFAVRPSLSASVERSMTAARIFAEGGYYDRRGIPIMPPVADTASTQPAAAVAVAPVQPPINNEEPIAQAVSQQPPPPPPPVVVDASQPMDDEPTTPLLNVTGTPTTPPPISNIRRPLRKRPISPRPSDSPSSPSRKKKYT